MRPATPADIPTLKAWDRDPDVIACTTDEPDADEAHGGVIWEDEIAMQSDVYRYIIAEFDGRPIGAMQVIDPHGEPTHYWGDIEPNLRAIDIWIGDAADRNMGHGRALMSEAINACFADAEVTAIVIDPLNSNSAAHRFYARLGFKPIGRRVFNDEDDCLVMRLERADWPCHQ